MLEARIPRTNLSPNQLHSSDVRKPLQKNLLSNYVVSPIYSRKCTTLVPGVNCIYPRMQCTRNVQHTTKNIGGTR